MSRTRPTRYEREQQKIINELIVGLGVLGISGLIYLGYIVIEAIC